MKNDRGFTLIELLVTIALISAVSIVIGVNILNMNERQEAKNIEQFKKKVEDAACTYADIKGITQTSETTYISTYCLIKDGYLKETPIPGGNDKLGNSEGGKNYKIKIEWKNDSEKVCTYTEEIGNTDCPNDAVNEPEPDPTPDPTPGGNSFTGTIYVNSNIRIAAVWSDKADSYPSSIEELIEGTDYYLAPISSWMYYVEMEIEDNDVTDIFVHFRENGNDYRLKPLKSRYSENKTTLTNASFKNMYCEANYSGSIEYMSCEANSGFWSSSWVHVDSRKSGEITVGNHGAYCSVENSLVWCE